MKPEIKLAIEVLEAAGYVVALNQAPEKFVPFKGQIGYAYDDNRKHRVLYRFIGMKNDKYMCTQLDDLNVPGVDRENFDPIPGLVQFQPWSELDDYTGAANVLFDDGGINHADHPEVFDGLVNPAPIGFQKLEK